MHPSRARSFPKSRQHCDNSIILGHRAHVLSNLCNDFQNAYGASGTRNANWNDLSERLDGWVGTAPLVYLDDVYVC